VTVDDAFQRSTSFTTDAVNEPLRQFAHHSVMITCWSCSTESSPAVQHPLNCTLNSVTDCYPHSSRPHVRKLNERDLLTLLGYSWQCVTVHRPAAGFTCGADILYRYRVADSHRTAADTDSNIRCSPWPDDFDAILAHTRYADGNYD